MGPTGPHPPHAHQRHADAHQGREAPTIGWTSPSIFTPKTSIPPRVTAFPGQRARLRHVAQGVSTHPEKGKEEIRELPCVPREEMGTNAPAPDRVSLWRLPPLVHARATLAACGGCDPTGPIHKRLIHSLVALWFATSAPSGDAP